MPPTLLQISEQQNDQALEVELGGKVVVSLGCNRSTGQSWRVVEPLPGELHADGESGYNAPPPTRAGAWGEEVFTFRAAKAGSARLRMAYGTEDAAAKPGRTFGVIINVRGEGGDEEVVTAPRKAAPAKKAAAPAKKAAAKKSATKKSAKG